MSIETKLTAAGVSIIILIIAKVVFKLDITNWGSEMIKGLDQWYKDKHN